MRGEFDFIERLRLQEDSRLDTLKNSSIVRGIGDDAAILRQRAGLDTVVTTDLLVEDIDFRLGRGGISPRDLGWRALAVSLSDIAAMGARPRFSLLSVGVPRERWRGR